MLAENIFLSVMWENIVDAASADNVCACLSKMIQVGFVELRGDTPKDLKSFWLFQHDLYIIEHMLIYNDRMSFLPQ